MNKESACIMICIVSKHKAKTLDLKHEFDANVTNSTHPVTMTTICHCLQSVYFAYKVDIISFYSNRI